MKTHYRTWARFFMAALLALSAALPAGAASGFLKITSNLDNLEVRINAERRQLQGRVLVAELPAGTYEVAAVGVGLDNLSRRVTIEADKVTTLALNVEATAGFKVKGAEASTVEQRTGALTIVTDLPGARVRLNGQPVEGSVTPLTVEGLTVGSWKVQVEAAGRKAEAAVEIWPDKTQVARLFFDPANERNFQTESRQKADAKRRLQEEFNAAAVQIEALKQKVEKLNKLQERYSSREGKIYRAGDGLYKPSFSYDKKESASFYDAEGVEHRLMVGVTGSGTYTKNGRSESWTNDHVCWVEVDEVRVFGVNRSKQTDTAGSFLGMNDKYTHPYESEAIHQTIKAGPFELSVDIGRNDTSIAVKYAVPRDTPDVHDGIRNCERQILELTQKRERIHFQLTTMPE